MPPITSPNIVPRLPATPLRYRADLAASRVSLELVPERKKSNNSGGLLATGRF